MAILVSPGIQVNEIDLTASTPAISTSIGATAGVFNWGPANTPIQITNETNLYNTFGSPDANSAASFFTAANFLSYSNNLQVVRVQLEGANNATSSGIGAVIPNEAAYFSSTSEYGYNQSGNNGNAWMARYPGELGNSIKVIVWDSADAWTANVTGKQGSNTAAPNYDPLYQFAEIFEYAPGTSNYTYNVTGNQNANDEIHIAVVDVTGQISGYANTVLEKYQALSVLSDAAGVDGSSNYYKEVIYRKSQWVYWTGHPSSNTVGWGAVSSTPSLVIGKDSVANNTTLAGGAFGITTQANLDSSLITALNQFADPESIDISLLMTANYDATVQQYAIQLATARKDCIAFVSPSLAACQDTTNPASAIVTYINSIGAFSSYAVADSGWKYQYDKYNDMYRWIPLNGDIAGLCAYTDQVQAPWWSPAGYQRGVVNNVIQLAFNPNQAARDTLYKAGINPVVSFPGQGTILYGDKTMQNRPSAFDRINVRRLFIVLEKTIAAAAKQSLFEFNDDFTRAQFVNLVDPFLRTVQAQRGVYSYRIVCDTTNNTPAVIDANQFVGDIYIQPARSINFIALNFVAVRTGVSFSEVVGQF